MIPYERRMRILQELKKREFLTLNELVSLFENVSESTLRRDLKSLNEDGQIDLIQGGAAIKTFSTFDPPISSRSIVNIEAKDKIAKFAAGLVKENDVVYIDTGTTALGLMKYLANKKITIVTTNVWLLNHLQGAVASCIVAGGEINKETASISGPQTEESLRQMFFDVAFLGTSGVDAIAGINTGDIREASIKRIVKANSARTYVLADSSKIGVASMYKAFEIGDCTIITDKKHELLQKAGNALIAE